MPILLTGGSGLVGREVGRMLLAAGQAVANYDIADGGADICDRPRLQAAMAGCSGVIHLAAISRVAWGEADPGLCHQVNVAGTELVLVAALTRAERPWVLFSSSREVYGDPDATPVQETASLRPVNHYGRSKAAGEALMAVARAAGLRTATLRLSNVYGGENDHPDRAVPSLMWRALQGQDLRLSGPEAFFDFVHVQDTARGIVLAANRLAAGATKLPAIHLATGVATSLGQLAEQAIAVTGSRSRIVVLPARSFDVKGFCGDPARAAEMLGWQPEIPLDLGLRRFLALLQSRDRALDPVDMPLAS